MKSKHLITFLFLCSFSLQNVAASSLDLISPDGFLKVKINIAEKLTYEVSHKETALLLPSEIAMSFNNGIQAGTNGVIKSIDENTVDETIPVLIGKNESLQDNYNEIKINFNDKYALVFRAYNDAVAYRFETAFSEQEVIVNNETANFEFAATPKVYFPEIDNGRYDHWEKLYKIYNSINGIPSGRFAVTPVMFTYDNYKMVLLEAGLFDYPGLYIQKKDNSSVKGLWPQYPNQVEDPDNFYSNHYPVSRFDYLAKTGGNRTYPWRVVVVSDNDKNLLNNEIVYKLAEPQRLTDVSWITPGKTTWEWGHKAILEGVDFPSGGGTVNLSLKLYQYYVDFAARNNIEYLTLDAGWSESYIRQLCSYAKARGVKIIVWTWTSCAVDQPGWMSKMKGLGISGYKIDFVNRDDQPAINWLETLAKRAADLQQVVMFHGCPIPTGLNRTYPNILNYEAVRGLENNYWDSSTNPTYNLQIPFIRMLAGSFDYTPGSMQNTARNSFRPIDSGTTVPGTNPMAMGTRCHHLAMYVIFDQPLGYMVDSPTEYEKYPDIMKYFQKVPTVWKKTVPLDARFGDYAITAKQTGNDWFVAGMTNWTQRTMDVNFSFLPEGIDYEATIYRDSTSSGSYPQRYVCEKKIVSKATHMQIFMASGGGFTMMLSPLNVTGKESVKSRSLSSAYIGTDKILNVYSKNMIQSVKIYNMTGQLVMNKSFRDISDTQKISLANMDKGVYGLEVETKGHTDILKFIY